MWIKIQNLLLPKANICTEEELFFRKEKNHDREIRFDYEENSLHFKQEANCFFNTYFNSLSLEKWKKYTNINNFSLNLKLQGDFEIKLLNHDFINDRYSEKVIDVKSVSSSNPSIYSFPYKLYEFHGTISFSLYAKTKNAKCFGGWYEGDIDSDKLSETNIAINICTYKREQYVFRNLDILNDSIINNLNCDLHNHLQIFISDNGKTLPQEKFDNNYIHIYYNKNVGGAGGFTRGMIEILKNNKNNNITHVLMMDDDIIIEPESLFRTYSLLRCRKKEYDDLFVGGAMLRIDNQAYQVESGASWNQGKLISNKASFDLKNEINCILNEKEEHAEYNAWWYCCTPISVVTETNLPLPIFIRGDDLEYGLRNMKHLCLMNGICVWHEAFENKYSSFLQYYILRNLLYDNVLHYNNYGLIPFLKRLYKSVIREIVYYRYKNVDLMLLGVDDFLKGVNFLKTTDGEQLHKKIMSMGYRGIPVDQLENTPFRLSLYYNSLKENESKFRRMLRFVTCNGYLLPAKRLKQNEKIKIVPMAQCRPINFYRQKTILNYDIASSSAFVTQKEYVKAISCGMKLFFMTIKSIFKYKKACNDIRNNIADVTNLKFWEEYLDIAN